MTFLRALTHDIFTEFLTRGIRNLLQNTLWTVALVYGFFKQATHSLSGWDFKLTLIARRSRHYAGTRYLKRGVNERGRVANDVETEQIVVADASEGFPVQISSVVQNRGSIPLFWSQETSCLNLKPDIILLKRDQTYQATRLHFENLVTRYGNPIIILNLIKMHEKRPRESILGAEFANAIESINKDLSEENHLKFLHWDLNKHSRSKGTNVLLLLGKLAAYALTLTGFFYCQITPALSSEGCLKCPYFENVVATNMSSPRHCNINGRHSDSDRDNDNEDANNFEVTLSGDNNVADGSHYVKPPLFQKGVLRTNCIDCLDRTNVAQYAYGLVALGQQLHALGIKDSCKIDLDDPLADELMRFYERMGDTLAHQYGGSAAHNKIFSQRRGQWKATTQSQEFFRTLQRYYNNAYMDAEKQSAINVFLGHFLPQHGKPEVWELDSDQHYNAYQNGQSKVDETGRPLFKRSLSENILHESRSLMSISNKKDKSILSDRCQERSKKVLSESTPDVSTCESDLSFSRYTKQMPRRELFIDAQRDSCEYENGYAFDCSNFVDLDWLSSSTNSCEEELFDRSPHTNSPIATLSSENIVNELIGERTPSTGGYGSSMKGRELTGTELSYNDGQNYEVPEDFSDSFAHWVTFGETLCH